MYNYIHYIHINVDRLKMVPIFLVVFFVIGSTLY